MLGIPSVYLFVNHSYAVPITHCRYGEEESERAEEKERERVGEGGKLRVLTAFVTAQHSYNHCRLLLVVLAYSLFQIINAQDRYGR
jgi:hypothetical protein